MDPLTILIVDEDPDMRLYLRGCLRGLGSKIGRVLEAADGLEALPLVRSGAVDLVISDLVLPRFDGYRLCRAIRSDPKWRHVPVLLLSDQDGHPTGEVAIDHVLEKPFNAQQLLDALGGLLLRLPRPPPESQM